MNEIIKNTQFLWEPLLESTAQTIVSAIGAYAIKEISSKFYSQNTFESPMDLWKRGIHNHAIEIGDRVKLECIISPYTQLFPCDPFDNAKLWRQLYTFEGKVSAQEYQAMEFYVGADETLRIGDLFGETLVGLYYRYGYIGEGIIGVIPTKILKKEIPCFFEKDFFASRVIAKGTVGLCPSQHGFVAQGIAKKAGIEINETNYANLPYINIKSIKPYKKDTICSLLATPWAVTDNIDEQYLLQYGYLDKRDELQVCLSNIQNSPSWDNVKVFFDDLNAPTDEIKFKNHFL